MIKKIISKSQEYINNYRGFKTNQKIVVFESDDWGAIRTSNNYALNKLIEAGVSINECHYMKNDCLESKVDLEYLFNVIGQFKDKDGINPVFTFNSIMANPNFSKIKDSEFNEYHYEPFYKTYERYYSENILSIYQKGINEGLVYPQLHGREHVNIGRWMNDLKNGRLDTKIGFEHEMYSISGHIVSKKRGSYLAVFDEIGDDKQIIEQIIVEGLEIFEQTFNFVPKTFIAPNYIWNINVENLLKKYGIISMQGNLTQILPTKNEVKQGAVKNFIGKRSENSMGYLIRNVLFEPSSDLNKDWVDSALNQIQTAFNNGRPAIIDTHRVNYIGSLNITNRENTLKNLHALLNRILSKWPDISFYHSEKLSELIYSENK